MSLETTPLDELEAFRQEWKREVNSRSRVKARRGSSKSREATTIRDQRYSTDDSNSTAQSCPPVAAKTRNTFATQDQLRPEHSSRDQDSVDTSTVSSAITLNDYQEPQSALEHYEKGVEREAQGSLGESLSHYRKAYRLDASVDRLFKAKHYPSTMTAGCPKSTSQVKSDTKSNIDEPSTVDDLTRDEIQYPAATGESRILAANYSDGTSLEPCPIAQLPAEILLTILHVSALTDPVCLTRLAQTCQCFADLSRSNDTPWKSLCAGGDYGFSSMHYSWNLMLTGHALPTSIEEMDRRLRDASLNECKLIPLTAKYKTYRETFRDRPRLRFNGCYISTVNYHRPGSSEPSHVTFTSPVLIVTYYRYLRFFRDGSCISLLTTEEPANVVHHLTKTNISSQHPPGLPSAIMNHGLRGRWKLTGDPWRPESSSLCPDQSSLEMKPNPLHDPLDEGKLLIETEGADAGKADAKYTYKMMLQLKNAARSPYAARNTKLIWLGFWSHNRLTDDWAEFGLKNDRAFFWSRVKSYGRGQ